MWERAAAAEFRLWPVRHITPIPVREGPLFLSRDRAIIGGFPRSPFESGRRNVTVAAWLVGDACLRMAETNAAGSVDAKSIRLPGGRA
jgi:hypothetical protein